MDSFFNDCLYAWDFKDSLVGEIGGIGWDNGTLMSSIDATYAKAGNCWMRSSSTNTTTSFLDLSDDVISINFWQHPSDFNVNYLIKLIDSNNKSLEVYLASSYVYVNYTNTGGTTTNNRSSSTITSINSIRLYTIIIDKNANTLKLRYNAFNNASGNFSSVYTVDISGYGVDFSSVKLQIHSAYYSYDYNLMRIWPKELTETDIQYLYNANLGRLLTMPTAKDIYENNCSAYYKLDETSGTTVEDATGNGHNGTSHGTIGNYSGLIEKCEFFNGNPTNYYTTLDTPYNLLSTSFSVSMWVKFTNLDGTEWKDSCLFVNGNGLNDLHNSIWISYDNGYGGNQKHIKFVVYNTNNNSYTLRAVYSEFNTSSWFHIVCTAKQEGGSVTREVYINGKLITSNTISQSLYLESEDSYPITIGRNGNYAARGLNGYVDEVGIWQRALSQEEIISLYNSGAGLPFENGPTYLVELTDGVGVTDDVSTKAGYKVDLQDIAYTTDSEDTKWDATVSFKDTVHVTDNVKVKMSYKVNAKDEVRTEDNQRIIIYKNGIDSIWTDRTKPNNTIWTNRPKPWIAK